MNIERAFRVAVLSLSDLIGLFGGDQDPAIADDGTIPPGSMYLKTGGAPLIKQRNPDCWTEISQWSFRFATNKASALDYIPSSVISNALNYIMPVDGVVVGVFCQARKVTKAPVGVEIWLEGQPHTPSTITLMESATPVYGSKLDFSAAVNVGDMLQIRMADTGGTANDLMVTVLFSRSSHS